MYFYLCFKQNNKNKKNCISFFFQVVKGWDTWYSWVTEVLERDYGDTSFSSFVKMVLAQGKEVKIGQLGNGGIR